MATLEINGRRVQVDDSFRSLSPDQQQATVEEIARSMGATPAPANNGGVSWTAQEWADNENLPVPGTVWNAPTPRYQPSAVPLLDPINAFANQAVENIPVAGSYLTQAGNQVDAWFNNMLGFPEQTAEDRAEINAAEAQRFPIASGTGAVAGAAVPLMVLGGTPMGGTLLGNTGSMVQRGIMGGLSGAAIAGSDAAARGGDINDIRMNALMGGGVGALIPGAERVINPVARALFGGFNPSPALSNVSRNLERSGIDPATLPSRLDALGPDSMLLDVSPNLTRTGSGIASLPGEGQTVLRDAVTDRALGTNARIQGDVNAILGEAPIPSRLAAEIADSRRALSPQYQAVLENARAVDTSGLAANLDSLIVNERGAGQQAAQQVRRMLNVVGTDELDPNPATLLNVRQAIDGILYTDGAMAPLDSNVKRILTQARAQVDAELAAKVPGIKEVDAQFSELAGQRGGIDTGQSVLSTGQNQVIRPAELQDMMAGDLTNIVGPSGVPFRISQGARAEIDRIIGTTGNDITALKQALRGDGSWNRDKLVTLYGKEKTDQLIGLLEREQGYQRTYNAIVGNSETAARQAAQAEVAPQKVNLDVQQLLFGLPNMAANAMSRGRSEATNAEIARMLVGGAQPELVDQLIAARLANRGVLGAAGVPVFVGNE